MSSTFPSPRPWPARSTPTSPSRATTPTSATTAASRSTTSGTRRRPRSSARWCAPAPRWTCPSTATCSSAPSTLPQRRLLQQHRPERDDQGVLGGRPDLRHQRQGQPQVHQVGRDQLRLAHADAGPRQGPGRAQERLPLRLLLQPRRDLPRLPAAARQDLDHQGAAATTRRRRRSRPPRSSSPTAATRPSPVCWCRPAAATTSPSTRRRTSRPAPAWATACSSTSPTG